MHFSSRLLALTLLLSLASSVSAQGTGETVSGSDLQETDSWDLSAVISGQEDVAVGRTIILDASSSRIVGENVEYFWYVDTSREPISRTVDMIYTPERTGTLTFRLVLRSTVGGEVREVRAIHVVTVYNRKLVLVADSTVTKERVEALQKTAAEAGVYLRVLQPEISGLPIGTEDSLSRLLIDQSAAFTNAETVIIQTEGIRGLQALMNAAQQEEEIQAGLQNQAIVLITSRSLNTIVRTARGIFSVLQPRRIFVTRKEAMSSLLSAENVDAFVTMTERQDIDLLAVDKSELAIGPWNILSPLITYMLTHGVSSEAILLLLVLPIIATILAFLKQIIGITTFGLYTPSIVSLSFLALGWQMGVVFLLFIIAAGYATRAFMQRWRLLYIPKVAIILTTVSITLLILLAIGASFNIRFPRETIFILLIMSTLAESFMNLKTEEGWWSALLGVGETILAALLCVFIVQTPSFQSFLLAYPEIIFLTIVVNIFLGRWTGLRLVEVFRFREVFKHLQEEE